MTRFRTYLVRILVLLLVASMLLPLVACRRNQEDPETEPSATVGEMTTYTVQITSVGGLALSGVGVYIYEDQTLAELVWFDQTDAEGKMTFTDLARDTYVAVLSDVPTGYAVEDYYPITGETTKIELKAAQMDGNNTDVVYKLGDMMMDFTVTGPDGTVYTLSELLQQKKAVVLNFWYVECGPCKAEFPYLQEAYEKYSEDIALLAMNPINTQEDIAAFQKENGYTFPMVSCGPEWEKLMGITAYPTTVVIDRFGNICLIHKGSIDNAKTFEDTFAYFTADDYEQKLIQDITELETEAEAGSAENPNEIGGQASFAVEVEAGKEVYTEVYKAKGMYMSIYGKNQDFYVIYNDKKYTPDSSGMVGFVVVTGDNYTPSVFGVGNTGKETQTFSVYLSFLAGTFNNPYAMKLGEFTVYVSAGNDQGVNYVWYAEESGKLTVQCLSATAGINYGYTLYNTNTMAVRSLEEDGSKDDKGIPAVSVVVNKGDKVLLTASTLPDDSNSYPAGTFKFLASFEAGEGTKVEKIEKIDYTVTVIDEAGKPLKNVAVWLNKDGHTASAKTDDKGIVTMNLEKGTYSGSISVPEGYTLENNSFELTEAKPTATVKLAKAVDTRVEYTVKAVDPEDQPVAGVEILILGTGSDVTDQDGTVTFKLEPGNYSVLTGTLPAGFTCSEMITLTADVLTGTLTLAYAPGTEQNPIALTEEVNSVTNAGTVYYSAQFNGAVMDITGPADFQVLMNGQTIDAAEGQLSQPITAADPRTPAVFAIVGDGEYTVRFTYPVGHRMNPAQMILGDNRTTQAAGASDYYYNWIAIGNGELTITMDADAQWLYSIANLTTGVAGETHWSDDETPVVSETVAVSEGDKIQVVVNTYDPANMFQTPAGDVGFEAAFLWTLYCDSFTTAPVPAGGSWRYRLTSPEGGTMTIESANAYVIYGSTTYGADSTGKVTLTLGTEEAAELVIGNMDADAQSFEVSFSWPTGTRRNPTVVRWRFPQTVTTRLSAGDTDGQYYLISPTQTGTLTITKNGSTAANPDYTVLLDRNNGEEILEPEADDVKKTISVYVFPDDQLLLHVQAKPEADGTYPAVNAPNVFSFTPDYSTYTVTYDANGGTLTGAATAETSGGRLAEMAADPVRTGYIFLGWFDAAVGGKQITTDTTIRADMTVYAQWEKVEYTVTFDPRGGTLEGQTTARTEDYKLTALPEAAMEGYTFLGWFDLPAGGAQITTDTVFTDNTTVYAQWKSNSADSGVGQTITYQVSVINEKGEPVTNGVYVTWQNADYMETRLINNASGSTSANLPVGTYTVMLTMTGTYQDYRYDTASAVTTAEKNDVTIQIGKPLSSTAVQTDYGDVVTLDVPMGATYVKLSSSQPNYAVIDGKAYCFFRYLATEEGKYSFTTSNGAVISNWGTNTFYIKDQTTDAQREANAFVMDIYEENFPEESHVVAMLFAVEVTVEYADTILLVQDAGDVEYTYMRAPFLIYEGTQVPAVNYENGVPVAVEENIYHLTTGGKSLAYVNMLTDKAVKGDDGLYHLNSKTGPVLYVNLGADAPYISMGTLTGAIGQYGTGFKKIFFNADGTPAVNADGSYKKEDYTDAMVAYCLHVDPTYGVYPLTDDLIYMLQHGGEFKGWYTPGSGTYLFEETNIEVDNSLAWMFAVCYLK